MVKVFLSVDEKLVDLIVKIIVERLKIFVRFNEMFKNFEFLEEDVIEFGWKVKMGRGEYFERRYFFCS